MKRQKIRKGLLLISLLLFPITIWYFSPYLIIQSAMEHVINGSFIVFMLMLILSTFMGRLFCSYLCPAGGIQECAFSANDKPRKPDWRYTIKYIIWSVWILSTILCYILGKGSLRVNFFYMTDHGISVSDIYCYIVYYGVVFLILVPSLLFGKRFACHYFCWMAPFMIIGSKIGQFLHIPQIHIEADPSSCKSCGKCSKECPMSLDVKGMVSSGKIQNAECIQCGACIDSCPTKALHYAMKH